MENTQGRDKDNYCFLKDTEILYTQHYSQQRETQ